MLNSVSNGKKMKIMSSIQKLRNEIEDIRIENFTLLKNLKPYENWYGQVENILYFTSKRNKKCRNFRNYALFYQEESDSSTLSDDDSDFEIKKDIDFIPGNKLKKENLNSNLNFNITEKKNVISAQKKKLQSNNFAQFSNNNEIFEGKPPNENCTKKLYNMPELILNVKSKRDSNSLFESPKTSFSELSQNNSQISNSLNGSQMDEPQFISNSYRSNNDDQIPPKIINVGSKSMLSNIVSQKNKQTPINFPMNSNASDANNASHTLSSKEIVDDSDKKDYQYHLVDFDEILKISPMPEIKIIERVPLNEIKEIDQSIVLTPKIEVLK